MALTRIHSATTVDKPIQAAGAVLWRPGPDGPEVALIHRPRYDDWSLPKGKVDPGEHALQTAVREVFEETGQRIQLGRRLPAVSYRLVGGGSKRVRYWVGRAVPDDERWGRFSPNHEVDQLEWLAPAAALARLSRPLDAAVLTAFLAKPAVTVPIVLLRHGTAQKRSADYFDDLVRPLAAVGHTQAETMAGLLPSYGPLRVVSSPAVRCVDTVRPYARTQQVSMDIDPALSEPAHAAEPDAIARWIHALIAEVQPTVLCSHREVLDAMLVAALERSGRTPTVNGRPWSTRRAERLLGPGHGGGKLKPGCAWVLHVAPPAPGSRSTPGLIAVDRLRL
ncbi:NUDIX hydrolase [Actinocrinis puniceicyclus]|uniref:NUDIX hydrolase n=1 Tax=Actinocrinis puniceicyclus TaxID=977794 RepID=A0A8J8BBB6_9ACTN|nr:NUDIX hydrolase [Actinocrinis puniceicyclus]MBS2962290.1 NUDIX hydrolase [Actinocrinis puniceicyclus]